MSNERTSPECACEIGGICRHKACCYYGRTVPANVRLPLVPELESFAAALRDEIEVVQAEWDKHAAGMARLYLVGRMTGLQWALERLEERR